MFDNYDEFYYYEDEEAGSDAEGAKTPQTRPKRSLRHESRKKQCNDEGCCLCKLNTSDVVSESEFRTYITYFIQVNSLK